MPFVAPQQPNYNLLYQGIMDGAKGIAAGIEGYYQKKEEKKKLDDAVVSLQKDIKSNPDFAKFLPAADDPNSLKAGINAAGGVDKYLQIKAAQSQLADMGRKQAEEAALKARMDSMLQMSRNPQGPLSNANAAMMQDPAMGAAMRAYGMSGSPRQATELYGEMMKQQAANAGRERAPQKALNLASYDSQDDKGRPIKVTVDELTGKEVGRGPRNELRYFPTADETRGIKMAEKDAENESKMNFDYVNDTINSAKSSKSLLSNNQKVVELYKKGAQSGWGQDFLTSLGSFGVTAGIIKKEDQAKQEQLRTAFAAGQLANSREFLQGQGSVTASERDRVDNAGARFENQDLANLNIVGTTMAIANHRIAKERERQRLYDTGLKSGADVAEKLRRWELDNDFEQFFPEEVTQLMDQIQRQDNLTKKGNPIKGAPR